METRAIVVATRNWHKIEEIRLLLDGLPVRLLTLDEAGVKSELVEDGDTFSENAAAKAEQASAACGLWSLADDSGLEIDALGGRPGVLSARYSGPGATDASNNAKIVAEARAAGLVRPLARFRCFAALRVPAVAPVCCGNGCVNCCESTEPVPSPAPLDALRDSGLLPIPGDARPAEVSLDGRTLTVDGFVEGVFVEEPRGGGGFGYDPHFLLPGLGRTMAEIPREEKNRISHRARAFGRMRAVLERLLAAGAAR